LGGALTKSGGGVLPGFQPLNQQDIEEIFKMCQE
jgi:hypothetical protein